MRQVIIILVYLLSVFVGFSQPYFKPAYIITRQNDTLFGKIDNRDYLPLSKSCIFLSGEGIKTKYTPDDIRAFRFIDGSFFVAKDIAGEKLFLEFLVKGKINLYYYYDGTNRYFIEKENEPLTEIGGGKSTLNYYTQDAPELRKKINEIEELNHKNMIALVQDYHNMVCDDEKCIVYVKKEYQTQGFKNIVGISPFRLINGLRIKYETRLNGNVTCGGFLTYYYPTSYMPKGYGGIQFAPFARHYYRTAPKGEYFQGKILGGIFYPSTFTYFGAGLAWGYQFIGKNNRWTLDINLGLKVALASHFPSTGGEDDYFAVMWWYIAGPGSFVDGLFSIGYRF